MLNESTICFPFFDVARAKVDFLIEIPFNGFSLNNRFKKIACAKVSNNNNKMTEKKLQTNSFENEMLKST